jgi:hypothetical protein
MLYLQKLKQSHSFQRLEYSCQKLITEYKMKEEVVAKVLGVTQQQ